MNTSKTRNRINFQSKEQGWMSTITAILLLIFNHYSMFEMNKLYSTSGICSYFRMHVYVPVVVGLCLRQDGRGGLMATFGMYVCNDVCMYVWYTHVTYAQTPSSLGMLPRCPQMVLQKEPKTLEFLCKSNQVGILGAYSLSSGLQGACV